MKLEVLLFLSIVNFSVLRLVDNPSFIFNILQIILFIFSFFAFLVFGSAGQFLIDSVSQFKTTQLQSKLESFDRRSIKGGGVFISYSHADKKIVRRIADHFKRDQINYWLDDKDMLVGQVIDKAISKGIQQSCLFLIILSPSSIKSLWVEREFDEASYEEIEGKKVILPVICNGLKNEDVPARIRRKLYVDLSRDFEKNYLALKKSILYHLTEFQSNKRG